MKKLFSVFIILFCNNIQIIAQSNWFIQSSGSDAFLWDIKMTDPNNVFIAASDGRVIRTTNAGANWISNMITPSGDLIAISFPSLNVGYAGGSQGKIFKTINAGVNWNQLISPSLQTLSSIYFTDNNTGYFTGGNSSDGEIFRTTNGGSNWNEVGPGVLYSQPLSIMFPSANTGFAVGQSGLILRSTNSGNNWIILSSPIGAVTYFSCYFTNENTGFAVTPNGGRIIKTTNAGNNWNLVYSDSNNFLVAINFPSLDTGFAAGGRGAETVVLKTTNAGSTWNQEIFNFNGHLNSIDFVNNSIGYIAGDQGRLYKTTNGGTPIGIQQISSLVPDKFFLSQNYPNPFNPVTRIDFTIASITDVKLIVYDGLGKEVLQLVNEKLAAGSYEVELEGANLPSGIYYYKMSADNFTEVKKMILLK